METPQKEIILEHTFPNGIHIDEYFEVDQEYLSDLRKAESIDAIRALIEKWRYLFPCLVSVDMEKFSFEEFSKFRGSPTYQDAHFKDEGAKNYIDILVPYELLWYHMISEKFGAPISVAMTQSYNAGLIEEKDGHWFLRVDSSNGQSASLKADTESQPKPE